MEVISVVIPAYNCADTISETIKSVLSQKCNASIEVVIVNDGSTDATHDVVEEIASNNPNVIVQHLSKASGRPSIPRNIGINLSNGEFVCFMDADDLMPQDYLDSVRKLVKGSHEFAGSLKHPFTDSAPPERDGSVKVSYLTIPSAIEYSKNVFTTSGLFIPRQLIGGKRFENIYLEDWRFLIGLYQSGARGKLLLSPRVFYRVHAKSLTPKNKRLQVRRVFAVLKDTHGLFAALILFAGYFMIGSWKISLESGYARKLFRHPA